MVFINRKGDIYGRDSFSQTSVGRNHRPPYHDFGTYIKQRDVWVDNVESDVGTCDDPCDIHRFQLPFSKSQRKDFK
jgi:hypothetical protein